MNVQAPMSAKANAEARIFVCTGGSDPLGLSPGLYYLQTYDSTQYTTVHGVVTGTLPNVTNRNMRQLRASTSVAAPGVWVVVEPGYDVVVRSGQDSLFFIERYSDYAEFLNMAGPGQGGLLPWHPEQHGAG